MEKAQLGPQVNSSEMAKHFSVDARAMLTWGRESINRPYDCRSGIGKEQLRRWCDHCRGSDMDRTPC